MSHNKPSCTLRPSSPCCLYWTKKNHAKSSLHTTNHRATRNPWPQRPRTVHESLIYTGVVWNSTARCHNKETDLLTKNDGLNPKTLPLQFLFAFRSQFGLAPSRWFEIPFHGCRYKGQLWHHQMWVFWWVTQATRFSCSWPTTPILFGKSQISPRFLTFFPSHA